MYELIDVISGEVLAWCGPADITYIITDWADAYPMENLIVRRDDNFQCSAYEWLRQYQSEHAF